MTYYDVNGAQFVSGFFLIIPIKAIKITNRATSSNKHGFTQENGIRINANMEGFRILPNWSRHNNLGGNFGRKPVRYAISGLAPPGRWPPWPTLGVKPKDRATDCISERDTYVPFGPWTLSVASAHGLSAMPWWFLDEILKYEYIYI